ncbi:MAG: glycosyltransferase family 39 protein [Anaerolineae bacterium]|nr:glycosyltransferase family 39 protein [Anaerolineae bacterium]
MNEGLREGWGKPLVRLGRQTWLLLVILLVFGLQASSLTVQSLWRDEVDAICFAHQFPHMLAQALSPQRTAPLVLPITCPPSPLHVAKSPEGGGLSPLAQVVAATIRHNGPFYHFAFRAWIALAGCSEYAARFFSLCFGILMIPLTYALGNRLMGRLEGGLAALLVAASPYLAWYNQEVKMYSLVPALALLSLYALRRAADEGGIWWAVHVVVTSLSFYTHVWCALLVPVQLILLVAWWPRWRQRWPWVLVGMGLITLPYLPLALWQSHAAFIEKETGFGDYSLGQMLAILIDRWSLGITGWGGFGGIIACGELALLGLASRPNPAKEPGWSRLGLVAWIVVPVTGIWFISQWQPLFTDRYLIWSAPAFYLLIAAGLAFLWRRTSPPDIRMLAVVLVIFAANLAAQATLPLKSDVRAAAAYLEERYRPGEMVLFHIPYVRYTFEYYFTVQDYAWREGVYTNHRREDGEYSLSDADATAQIAGDLQGCPAVWLVLSEAPLWDERGLVQGWLEGHGERLEEAHFAHVSLYYYRLGNSWP